MILLLALLLLGATAAVAMGSSGEASTSSAPDPNVHAGPEQPATPYGDTAAGRRARAASRSAYAHESDREALATGREQFAEFFDEPVLRWPVLRDGDRLTGYVNDETGVATLASGKRAIVDSTLPLRGRTPDGAVAPLDLGLIDAGHSELAPRSAPADVRIPDRADGELRFPDRAFGVAFDGAKSNDAAIDGNKAFFANVAQDTDLVLEPRPEGAELSVVLRSSSAPAVVPLRFHLAGGERLSRSDGSGSDSLPQGSVEVTRDGKRVGSVLPAHATDAQGQSVPVSYALNGDRLELHVDTTGDIAYPVLVDPIVGVYDNNGTSTGPGTTGYTWPNWDQATYADAPGAPNTTWSACNNSGSFVKKFYFCQGSLNGMLTEGGPLFIRANTTLAFADTDWAEWIKYARADSYIYAFDTTALSSQANNSQLYVGVWSQADFSWETGSVMWGNGSTSRDAAPAGYALYETYPGTSLVGATRYLFVHGNQQAQPDPATPIAPNNIAAFGINMAAGTPGTPTPYVQMGGAATYSSETYAPTLGAPSHTNPPPSGWANSYSDSVAVSASDRGLGMGRINLSGPGLSASHSACTQNGAPSNNAGLNASNYYDSCPLALTMPSTAYTAPEGIDTYTASATDLVGNHAVANDRTWQVKVDNTGPQLSVSGSLWTAQGTTVQPGTYTIHADASDGGVGVAASAARSGLQSIVVKVDGDVEQTYTPSSCSSTGCAGSTDYTLDTADWPAEQHTVDVVATDQLGHQATRTMTVTIAGAAPELPTVESDVQLPEEVPDVAGDPTLVQTLADLLYPNPSAVSAEQASAVTDLAVDNPLDQVTTSSDVTDTSSPAQSPSSTRVATGVNATGLGAVGWTPSDSTGAIGTQRYVEMVNSDIAVYSRSLGQIAQSSLASFVGAPHADVFDPQIIWDGQTQRWYYVAMRVSGQNNYLAFGWSKTDDPGNLSSGWCKFFKPTGTHEEDYPKLGDDLKHMVIGTNMFIGKPFYTAHIWAIPKPLGGDTGCSKPATYKWGTQDQPLKTGDNNVVETPVPAQTGRTSSHVDYVAASDAPADQSDKTGHQIQTWHVSGARNSPRLTRDANVSVSQYRVPADVHQPNSDRILDASDARLTQAVAMGDPAAGTLALWTQHTIRAPGGRSRVRWYELLPRAGSPRRQQGNIENAQHSVFNGAIAPTGNGGAIIDYNVGSDTLLPQIRARSRLSSTSLGRMTGEITLASSAGSPDHDFSCYDKEPEAGSHECRWGDYAAMTADPNASDSAWGTNMALGPDQGDTHAHWKTQNFQLFTSP